MRKTGLVIIGALLLVFASCKKEYKINDVNITESTDTTSSLATDSTDMPLTGEIWDEEHRFCQETDSGQLVRVKILHANGTKAFEVEMDKNGNRTETRKKASSTTRRARSSPRSSLVRNTPTSSRNMAGPCNHMA